MCRDTEMVLMDAGAKHKYYCSDITRTFPINGHFSPAQRELYEMVLRVQQRCISALSNWPKLPRLSLNILNAAAMHLFIDELSLLGFRDPPRAVQRLFPHSIGHYLGMDLHDCPSISYDETLRAQMVITIEPGIYVPHDAAYPSRYQGIGVRIEDDIVLNATGCENLTASVPREVDEIESLMRK